MNVEEAQQELDALKQWLGAFQTMQQQVQDRISRANYLQGYLDGQSGSDTGPSIGLGEVGETVSGETNGKESGSRVANRGRRIPAQTGNGRAGKK